MQNDLEFFRLRGRELEVLCAPSADFLVIVLQRWRPAGGGVAAIAGDGGHADGAAAVTAGGK